LQGRAYFFDYLLIVKNSILYFSKLRTFLPFFSQKLSMTIRNGHGDN
jgi:hypothetical protein